MGAANKIKLAIIGTALVGATVAAGTMPSLTKGDAPHHAPRHDSIVTTTNPGWPSQATLDRMSFVEIAYIPGMKPCDEDDGQPAPCYWDAGGMGNGQGTSFYTTPDGAVHLRPEQP
jgi:hypothetical protein